MSFKINDNYDTYKNWINADIERKITFYADLSPRDNGGWNNRQADGTNPGFAVYEPASRTSTGAPQYGNHVNRNTPWYRSFEEAVTAAMESAEEVA